MANKRTTIQVDVTGDARSAIKALGEVTAKMGTMQRKAVAVGSAIGSFLGRGVSAAISAVKDLGGEVLAQSDSIQKFKSTMEFAGFDPKAIKAATKATKDYADQTVYDLTTVQSTTAQLAANGVGDYVGLTKAAGNLNAVAGGNAETFKSVAMVLTQTAGAGKLTTENWNQLSDAIPGAAGRLQKALQDAGAYTGNFRDALEDGQISAEEFNRAIMSLGMEDAAQKAATSTETFEGAWGNMMASVTGGLAGLVNIVKPGITDSIGWMANQSSSWFDSITSKAQSFYDGFTSKFDFKAASVSMEALGRAFGSIGGAIGKVSKTIAPFLGQIGGIGGIGGMIAGGFNVAAGAISYAAGILEGFGAWVSAHAEPISMLIVGIGTGFAAFKAASIISAAVSALKGFSAASTAASAAQWLMNAAMAANPILLVVTLVSALTAALVWFLTQTETGRQVWQDFTSFLGACVQGIIDWFQALPGKITAFFSAAADGARSVWSGITGYFGGIWSGIASTASSVVSGIESVFSRAADGARSVWSGITGFFSGIWSGIVSGASSIVGGIRAAFSSAVNAAKSVFNGLVSFVQGIWDRITGIVSSITNGVKGAWDTITSILPFSAAPARARSMGYDMPTAIARAMPMAMPLMAVGGADSQGASHGAPTGTGIVERLINKLSSNGGTSVTYVTYNVELPAKMMVGSKSELIRWIKQGLADAERRVS